MTTRNLDRAAKPTLGKPTLVRPALAKPASGKPAHGRRLRSSPAALAAVMLGCAYLASAGSPLTARALAVTSARTGTVTTTAAGGSSLEAAATKAGEMGRKVAMSLIGLALAVAGIVLAFRRDFRKVAGVLVVGMLAILLATPVGVSVLKNTVAALFGSA
jgi:FtsH-binding integral membrane protein